MSRTIRRMASSSSPQRTLFQRLGDEALYRWLRGFAAIVGALPSRWAYPVVNTLGSFLYAVDRRGRRVGRQNLIAIFGDALTARERRAILVGSFRNSVMSVGLLLHIAPMTRERYLRWVDVPPEVEERLRATAAASNGFVIVSGHIGNWELLLGLPTVFEGFPEMVFLTEGITAVALDRLLAHLRGSGGGVSALRHGGARTLNSHVRRGGVAALLADRNVRSSEGGVWAPFLGLQASTTPLPAWLAVRNGVHLLPILCLPQADGRYRIWVGPNLAEGVDTTDRDAAILEITTRISRVLESAIRAQPEIWNWTLKRFKSRPDRELGPYPPYSLWNW